MILSKGYSIQYKVCQSGIQNHDVCGHHIKLTLWSMRSMIVYILQDLGAVFPPGKHQENLSGMI